jgi:hypothetical protein
MYMLNTLTRLLVALLVLGLISCGGGDSPSAPILEGSSRAEPGTAETPLTPTTAPPEGSVAPYLVDAENMMDAMELRHPEYFPPSPPTLREGGIAYRFYPATETYLAVRGEQVQVLGPRFGRSAVNIGSLSEFACDVFPEECMPGRRLVRSSTQRETASPGQENGVGGIGAAIVDAVRAAFPNRAPIAIAAGGGSVTTGSAVTFYGTSSYDPDGDALTYSWTLYAPISSKAILFNSSTNQAKLTPDVAGTYIATLTVSDGTKSASASVSVIAISSSPYCCKHCTTGKPCGDTCISSSYTCHVGPGCACY